MGNKTYVTFWQKGWRGAQALDTVERICYDLKMVKAFDGIVATRKPTDEDLAHCNELGKKLARSGV